MNTSIINNTKVKLVVAEFGSRTWAVLLPLLCKIYSEKGYWFDWCDNDAMSLFVLDEVKEPESFVREVVSGLIRRSFFDKEVFDTFGVLTSKRIQENYFEATKRRNSVDFIEDFKLLNDDVYIFKENVNIVPLNTHILSKKVNASTQNKLNKTKTNETKIKKNIYAHFSHLTLTVIEFDKLTQLGYSKAQIDSILESIENYKKNTSYKSLYLTVKKWLEKEQPEKTQSYPAPTYNLPPIG